MSHRAKDFAEMTSAQLPCFTELSSALQLNGKISMLDGVNHMLQLPLVTDVTLESPLPSIQSWYPSLMTSDGVRYIAHSDPLVYNGSVAPSVFLSSAADRNYECVLDMEGQAIQDDHIITDYVDSRAKRVKCEEDHDVMKEMAIEDNSDRLRGGTQGGSAVCPESGDVINFGPDFTIENVVSRSKHESSRKKRRMVTTVATQTPPENSFYDDMEPVKLPVRYLYEFLELLLSDERYNKLIVWKNKEERVFMLIDHHKVAEMWGMHKRKKPMTYDKFSRALRFYYSKNILKKEPGRFTYRFLIQEGEVVQYF